jgi:hypothetical protein
MQIQNEAYATVTNIVWDFMFVQIISDVLQNKTLEYKIFSLDDKLIRKGHFEGPIIQLRLSHIQEGNYIFQLYLNNIQLQQVPFEKRAGFTHQFHYLNEE